MKITRNGNEYELTSEELWNAYFEKEKELIASDLVQHIDDMFADGLLTRGESGYLIGHIKDMLILYDKMEDCNVAYNDTLHSIILQVFNKRKEFLKVGSVEKQNGEWKIYRDFYRQGNIFKDEDAYLNRKDEPCYVAELSDRVYTGNDFLELCEGQKEFADMLFYIVDWQHPESELADMLANREWVECEHCGKWVNYGEGSGDVICPNCGKKVEE